MFWYELHSQVRLHTNARSDGEPALWFIAENASATDAPKAEATWPMVVFTTARSWSLPGTASASGL